VKKRLSCEGAGSVDQDVKQLAVSSGDKGLVILVAEGIQHSHQQR
jgi:hypothetical protein